VVVYSNLYASESSDYVEFILGAPPDTKARKGTAFHLALEIPDMDKAIARLNAIPPAAITSSLSKHTPAATTASSPTFSTPTAIGSN
jgi:hypothetical protein